MSQVIFQFSLESKTLCNQARNEDGGQRNLRRGEGLRTKEVRDCQSPSGTNNFKKYNSVVNGNELSSHEKTWWKLKCILLNETSRPEKATYYMIPAIRHCGKDKTMETVKR